MEMSGIDQCFPAAPGIPVTDIVLRACRRFWPRCVVRDADGDSDHAIVEPYVWMEFAGSDEFFVYRSSEDAQDWHENGLTDANKAAMLHLMLDPPADGAEGSCTVEFHDENDPTIRAILETLGQDLYDARLFPEIDTRRAGEAA
jgi:hypothetical protein